MRLTTCCLLICVASLLLAVLECFDSDFDGLALHRGYAQFPQATLTADAKNGHKRFSLTRLTKANGQRRPKKMDGDKQSTYIETCCPSTWAHRADLLQAVRKSSSSSSTAVKFLAQNGSSFLNRSDKASTRVESFRLLNKLGNQESRLKTSNLKYLRVNMMVSNACKMWKPLWYIMSLYNTSPDGMASFLKSTESRAKIFSWLIKHAGAKSRALESRCLAHGQQAHIHVQLRIYHGE